MKAVQNTEPMNSLPHRPILTSRAVTYVFEEATPTCSEEDEPVIEELQLASVYGTESTISEEGVDISQTLYIIKFV